MSAVAKAYPDLQIDFVAEEFSIPNRVDRLNIAFDRVGVGPFEKWRAASALRDIMRDDPSSIPDEIFERAQKLVAALNLAFEA